MRNILAAIIVVSFLATPAWAEIGVADLKGTAKDSSISGRVIIKEKDDGILVKATVKGVSPGKHGFHFHEVGSCQSEGNAAGGHYNPEKVSHGFLPKDGKKGAHLGDMGNITVDESGKGRLEIYMPGVYLSKTPAVGGIAIILHEKEDDFGQPTGNAGSRIACGVVELEKLTPAEEEAESEENDSSNTTTTNETTPDASAPAEQP